MLACPLFATAASYPKPWLLPQDATRARRLGEGHTCQEPEGLGDARPRLAAARRCAEQRKLTLRDKMAKDYVYQMTKANIWCALLVVCLLSRQPRPCQIAMIDSVLSKILDTMSGRKPGRGACVLTSTAPLQGS